MSNKSVWYDIIADELIVMVNNQYFNKLNANHHDEYMEWHFILTDLNAYILNTLQLIEYVKEGWIYIGEFD